MVFALFKLPSFFAALTLHFVPNRVLKTPRSIVSSRGNEVRTPSREICVDKEDLERVAVRRRTWFGLLSLVYFGFSTCFLTGTGAGVDEEAAASSSSSARAPGCRLVKSRGADFAFGKSRTLRSLLPAPILLRPPLQRAAIAAVRAIAFSGKRQDLFRTEKSHIESKSGQNSLPFFNLSQNRSGRTHFHCSTKLTLHNFLTHTYN